jgi:F-type H+-transporting ATPase subunit delta
MSNRSIIVQAYAKALFNSCNNTADLIQCRDALVNLKCACADSNLKILIANKSIDRSQVLEILKELIKVFNNPVLNNFCIVMVCNGVLAYIPEISAKFDKLLKQKNNEIDVVMEYAFTPTQEIYQSYEQFLSNKFNKKIIAKLVINPDLLAGAKFTIDDLVIDASLQSRINQLSANLLL